MMQAHRMMKPSQPKRGISGRRSNSFMSAARFSQKMINFVI